jgi:hypothetical protein
LYVPITFAITLFPGLAKVFSAKKISAGNLQDKDFDGEIAVQSRIGILAMVLYWSLIIALSPITISTFLVFFVFGSLLWSTTQYVDHAYAEKDVVYGAHNLELPPILSIINLGREYDLNHHLDPRIPWTELRKNPFNVGSSGSYIKHYFKQWSGPEILAEGESMAQAVTTEELLSMLRVERKKLIAQNK